MVLVLVTDLVNYVSMLPIYTFCSLKFYYTNMVNSLNLYKMLNHPGIYIHKSIYHHEFSFELGFVSMD